MRIIHKLGLCLLPVVSAIVLSAQATPYADHLMSLRRYPAAIMEYERSLYFENHTRQDSLIILRNIVRAYYGAGLYDQMTEFSSRHALLIEDREYLSRYVALAELSRGRYELARLIPEPETDPNALLLRGIAELYQDRGEQARNTFSQIPDNLYLSRAELLRISRNMEKLPRRSPLLAGSLALIPGAGYAYNGKWQTAISSLLLHAAFFATAWELRQNDLPVTSAMVALAGTAYYLGNIYGSATESIRSNLRTREKYLDAVLAPYIYYLEDGPDIQGTASREE